MNVSFVRKEELVPGIWQYYFRPKRPVDFVPGQYVSLQLPDVMNDPRGASRTFTLTSLPGDALLSFVVKILEPRSLYKHVLLNLTTGAEGKIGDAMGDLVLPKSPDLPLVYIAGGIGIASFASMFKQLLAVREVRPIFLFYALRSRREQIFCELYDMYPLQLKQVVFAPNRLSAREIRDTTPPDALVYLSGSQDFVESIRVGLETLGTPRGQIVFDYYDGYFEL